MDWENAIFHMEWCLEILETVPRKRVAEFKQMEKDKRENVLRANEELELERSLRALKSCDRLRQWIIPPLVDLYHMKKQYMTAFDYGFVCYMQFTVLRLPTISRRRNWKIIFFKKHMLQYISAPSLILLVIPD
uniref:Uncharacterized protein n=1 Tax=Physcomitrium patens TaxID=3218 RepID=A0A2K1J3A0_PHYPA|nr:hypothetical protein PHYPA_021856 [Physcomitrium patens]